MSAKNGTIKTAAQCEVQLSHGEVAIRINVKKQSLYTSVKDSHIENSKN